MAEVLASKEGLAGTFKLTAKFATSESPRSGAHCAACVQECFKPAMSACHSFHQSTHRGAHCGIKPLPGPAAPVQAT